jgi:hypothetical protein
MNIHIEGFDINNNYFNLYINPKNTKIKYLNNWNNYEWYLDNELLSPYYNDWKQGIIYQLVYNSNYINVIINKNNKTIISPLIDKNTTIRELKDILSIKDNIYFHRILLQDDMSISDYNIDNMDTIYSVSPSVVALDC